MKAIWTLIITMITLMAGNIASAHPAPFPHPETANQMLHYGFHMLWILIAGTVVFLISRYYLLRSKSQTIKQPSKK